MFVQEFLYVLTIVYIFDNCKDYQYKFPNQLKLQFGQ